MVEVSSFQLERADTFAPVAAALLNLESDHINRYAGGFEEYCEVKRRILLGTLALTKERYDACYGRASRIRAATGAALREALGRFDLLLLPASPETAWRRGEKRSPVALYRSDLFAVPASMAGLPAVSVPFGAEQGLPVGMQLVGRAFEEAALLRAARALEEENA